MGAMFKKVRPKELFPTYVWTYDLEDEISAGLNVDLMNSLDELTPEKPALAHGHKWQTDQNLHEFEEFAELVKIFRAAMTEIIDLLGVECTEFEITGCWANISPKFSYHGPHHHANNFLSGIYYVAAPKGGNTVIFHEPRSQPSIIEPKLKTETKYYANAVKITVKPGRMIIFPSWLTHSVPPSTADTLRVSISYNIMFSDFTKRVAKPRWEGNVALRKPGG
jgi:uncharacterized protein (TIGR02466 family)